MEAYLSARSVLVAEERSLRRDHLRLDQATKDELRADEIVRAIRASEAASVWSVEHESVPNVFPGMQFLTARSVITKTKLFEILTKMPKGALLHCHLGATVNGSVLLKLALDQLAIHVRVATALDESSIKYVLPEFRALEARDFSTATSVTSASYTPNTWVHIKQARQTFSPALGGPMGFDKWVIGAMMINPTEAYVTHNTVEKIWLKFSSTFMVTTPLTFFEPIWVNYIREFLRASVEDGISYIEARIGFAIKYMVGADCQENIPHRQWLLNWERAVEEVKMELSIQGRADEFIGARMIYTAMRDISCDELEWYLEDCIALKQEFPHLIVGFDLVGDENALNPLIFYIAPLLRFQERQKELGIDIPFLFHAGETLGDGDGADTNLFDAILLGTKRIGHGFSLAKHPNLISICREKGITIEVCPISNEILRLTSSMPAHPLSILINNGVPVALGSDDPAIFGNMGLSFDFFQVLVASEVTGLITLGDIARQSIESSTLDEADKRHALECWERRWAAFVKDIVVNHDLQAADESIRGL